ncbi:hypothetical protein DPMN_071469 [Dreissena polymorpha]|uniref:Uncharacterized protein n=1 Tax=Dreissena polymorpha TaxID=45954 RepID=A0A9D3Z2Q2_DREPO|nr:hypothetical protein DPMN_071469 [Dreissena polymorpha]
MAWNFVRIPLAMAGLKPLYTIRRRKAVKQQKQELDTTEKNYKDTVRKLKDDSSAALTRNVLPTERWALDDVPLSMSGYHLSDEGLDDVPLSTSGDQSAQIQELKREISRLNKVVEQQKLAFDTTKKDYEAIVKKLTDELTAALTREQLHKSPGEMKQEFERAENIICKEFDELVEKIETAETKVQQLKRAEHLICKEYDELVEKFEKAETKVQQLENDMKVCNIQKEKELLQEELTRKKEGVRQLHQYKEVMEKRHGILTATIQMLKQDSPKTDHNNDSLKKLIEEDAKLKIESDIMNVQLQKLATVTDPLSEMVNEASMETTEEKTRVLFANNSISDKYESRDNVRVVAFIHIGSQFTELAFSMTSNPTRIKTLNWNEGISKKEKTNVLIKEDGKTFEAFGDEAEQMYSNLVFKNNHKERYMFRDFMLQLYKEKIIGVDTKLKDADGKTLNALQVVSTTIRQIQSKLMTRLKAQFHDSRFDEKDMYWVLTFPPGHNSAKTFMTKAALQAGIDRHMSVVMDIETIVCFFPQLDVLMEENRISTVATGTRHIVCDSKAEKVGFVIKVPCVYKINLMGNIEFMNGCRAEIINEAFANI